jgi:hypothetical protein
MNKNRCCREVGSDLTTYTSYVPLLLNPNISTSTVPTSLEYDPITFGLTLGQAPGLTPNDPYRYSRLATVENLGTASRPTLNAFQDRVGSALSTAQGANVMTPYQWKTLGESNSETCCGGGWIRKFSDGGNDWSRRDRLYMDVKNFACINSRTALLTHPEDYESQYYGVADVIALVNQDYGDYCKDTTGTKGSCAQFSISTSSADIAPYLDTVLFTSNHFKSSGMAFGDLTKPYLDFNFHPKSADGNSAVIMDFSDPAGRRNIKIKIPSFIPRTSFDDRYAYKETNCNPTDYAARANGCGTGDDVIWASVVMLYNTDPAVELTPGTGLGYCTIPSNAELTALKAIPGPLTTNVSGLYCPSTMAGNNQVCCHAYDPTTRILTVIPKDPASFAGLKVGVKISNGYPAGGNTLASTQAPRTIPGSSTYYLKRLGLLELTGIPQITYKPLTCNDNSLRMVPGIFKKAGFPDMKISHFNDNAYSFDAIDPETSISSRYTNVHGLDLEPIFSENDFKCCSPLGYKTTTQSKCCSGYGKLANDGTTYTCGIPAGTDLMVYFNRFVSNEGRGSTQPGGGLVDADFSQLTGEPLITTTVSQKISALGSAYCANAKVRQGGAFSSFNLEPYGNDTNDNEKIYGIVDSTRDETAGSGSGPGAGYTAFMSGFRWNHHLYCDD